MRVDAPSWVNALIWLGFGLLFLVLELPAAFVPWWPWDTLSETCWRFEHWWHLAKVLLALFLFALGVHLLWHVPVRWLEAVALAAAFGAIYRLVLELTK